MAAVFALAGLTALPAPASVIYNNDFGGEGFANKGWTINYGYSVTDSFESDSDTTITGIEVALWLLPDDSLSSIAWSIANAPSNPPLNSGVAYSVGQNAIAQELIQVNSFGYSVWDESFAIPGFAVTAGTTYWLSLADAQTLSAYPVFWDESGGPSAAQESVIGQVPSQSFILTSVPEPATVTMLAVALLAAFLLKKTRRRSCLC